MITFFIGAILIGLVQIIIYPITFLPGVAFPGEMTTSISLFGGTIHIFGLILPTTVPTIFSIFTIFIGIEAGIFGYKIIKWIYSKIPGIN
jgi:hypothetical protein